MVFWLFLIGVNLSSLVLLGCNMSKTFFFKQGNIRVFCRVRPLVDGGLSKHIQLPTGDNTSITLAKTEEVRILLVYQTSQSSQLMNVFITVILSIIQSFTNVDIYYKQSLNGF